MIQKSISNSRTRKFRNLSFGHSGISLKAPPLLLKKNIKEQIMKQNPLCTYINKAKAIPHYQKPRYQVYATIARPSVCFIGNQREYKVGKTSLTNIREKVNYLTVPTVLSFQRSILQNYTILKARRPYE